MKLICFGIVFLIFICKTLTLSALNLSLVVILPILMLVSLVCSHLHCVLSAIASAVNWSAQIDLAFSDFVNIILLDLRFLKRVFNDNVLVHVSC